MIRPGGWRENPCVDITDIPDRKTWKQDLARYLEVDTQRSLGQIASVVLPYLGVWVLVARHPARRRGSRSALGLVATVFLVRMYSLFHDLTHNSMFGSRRANAGWGHLLGFLLFTPYRWWQRQHSLHHAHAGNLDHRGPGEINTMTLAEYESASRLRRLGYRLYRNPLLMLLVGPSLVFLFERRFPQRGMSRRILISVLATNLALVGWALGWSALVGWQTYLIVQATTLVAGGAIAAWMLYIQHQYEDTYYQAAGDWQFELAALQGSSYLRAPARARVGGRQRELPPRPPPQREDPQLPPARRPRGAADVRPHARGHRPQQRRRAAPEAVGRGERLAGALPGASPRAEPGRSEAPRIPGSVRHLVGAGQRPDLGVDPVRRGPRRRPACGRCRAPTAAAPRSTTPCRAARSRSR